MSGMTDPSRNDAPKKDGRDGGVQSVSQQTNAGSRRMIALAVCLIVVAMLIVCVAVVQAKAAVSRHRGYRGTEQVQLVQPQSAPSDSASSPAQPDSTASGASDESSSAAAIDWQGASGGAYPDVSQAEDLSISVSLADQRVYIKDGDTTIYTMICSSGMDDSTPHGTFTVQSRGENFFNSNEQMGANWWVSFYGDYLFHTVPTDSDGNYIVSEAEKLGRPASHGCLRLTVSDAKWIYDNIPDGTTVVIA